MLDYAPNPVQIHAHRVRNNIETFAITKPNHIVMKMNVSYQLLVKSFPSQNVKR